jgi:hypothetical protein
MTTTARIGLLLALLTSGVLLAGCPGMPGAPSAGQQNTPPGILPPPGLQSGGARTIMGTTITPPDNSTLLVSYSRRDSAAAPEWHSCRRIIILETSVLIEGINYDRRTPGAEEDFNEVVPFSDIRNIVWKYEPKPTPPAEEKPSQQKTATQKSK